MNMEKNVFIQTSDIIPQALEQNFHLRKMILIQYTVNIYKKIVIIYSLSGFYSVLDIKLLRKMTFHFV